MLKILEGTKKEIENNIHVLAADYKDKFKKKVCLSCPSDVRLMILSLKNYYMKTQFQLKKFKAQYKNKKGDKTTISNATMTDEKAVEFLKTNPDRIRLFSEFPKDWEKMLEGKKETPRAKEIRLAIQAEIEAKEEAGKKDKAEEKEKSEAKAKLRDEKAKKEADENQEIISDVEQAAIDEARKISSDASSESSENNEEVQGPTEAELNKMLLKDLRIKFPKIKATSKKVFIQKVLK